MPDDISKELSEEQLDGVAGGVDSQLFNTSSSLKSPFYKGSSEPKVGKEPKGDSESLNLMEEEEAQV